MFVWTGYNALRDQCAGTALGLWRLGRVRSFRAGQSATNGLCMMRLLERQVSIWTFNDTCISVRSLEDRALPVTVLDSWDAVFWRTGHLLRGI